jgi:hypothetical protein
MANLSLFRKIKLKYVLIILIPITFLFLYVVFINRIPNPISWKKYSNSEYQISFRYPRGWDFREKMISFNNKNNYSINIHSGEVIDVALHYISIRIEKIDQTPKEYIDTNYFNLQLTKDYQSETFRKGKVDGLKFWDFKGNASGYGYVFQKNGNVYIIYGSRRDKYIDSLVSTLKI